jgi:hypothetical protein
VPYLSEAKTNKEMKTKQSTYIKDFKEYDEAFEWTVMKNKVSKEEIFCLVPGPDDNYCVVDLRTAIELGLGYVIATSHLHYIKPF